VELMGKNTGVFDEQFSNDRPAEVPEVKEIDAIWLNNVCAW